jgi:hypothetical protein
LPRQNRGAQEVAAIEPPFLWILSFGGAKESISPSGAITRDKYRRDSDRIIFFYKPLNGYVTSVHKIDLPFKESKHGRT